MAILDDDKDVLESLAYLLKKEGFDVLSYIDQNKFIQDLLGNKINVDCIILDLIMPEIDGKTVLRNIRPSIRDNNISVIIFSAVDDVNKRVELLNLGANDFFNKCGSIDELVARINVQCRNDILIEAKQDNCRIDIMNKSLLLFGKEIKMTLTELQIVNLLINNKSRYVSRDTFQKRIYNYYESDIYHPFDAAIHRIRTKVKKYTDKDLILSHRNKGWKLNYDLINITKSEFKNGFFVFIAVFYDKL